MKNYLFVLFVAIINVSCSQNKSKLITEVSPEELKTVVLLDVRTENEFLAGHLPNAININWFDANFQKQIETNIPKDKKVYVYCKMGGRSAKATEKLIALGYTVTNLEGGYDAYIKSKQ